jgi:cell division protein FtsB
LVLLACFSFTGDYNFSRIWRLEQKRKALVLEIEKQEELRKQLILTINGLKSNSDEIERIAREEFKMGRTGEKILIIKDQQHK